MAGNRKFKIQIGLSLLFCALLFGGCGEQTRGLKLNEVGRTPAEEEKARLLKEIDRKFENPEAHFELGQLYQADSLWAKAEHQYNITLNFDPVHRGAQAAMVKVLMDSGNTAKSKLCADIYMNQASISAAGSFQLALAFQRQGLDEYELACYRQALRLAPNSPKINKHIGYYYLSKGNKELAKEYLSRSFHLDPQQPEVAGELGRLGVVVRIPRKAEKRTKKLVE